MFLLLLTTFFITVSTVDAKLSSTATLTTGLTIATADSFNKLNIELKNLVNKPIHALDLKKDEWSQIGKVDVLNTMLSLETDVYLYLEPYTETKCTNTEISIEVTRGAKTKNVYTGALQKTKQEKKESDEENVYVLIAKNLKLGENVTVTQKARISYDNRRYAKDITCKWDEVFQAQTRIKNKIRPKHSTWVFDNESILNNTLTLSQNKQDELDVKDIVGEVKETTQTSIVVLAETLETSESSETIQ